MDYLQKLITDIELHSVDGIIECFEHGIDPNMHFNNQPLIYELISEYARGTKFKECVQAFAASGLIFDDKALLAVLMDDAQTLENLLTHNSHLLGSRYTFKCAFTPIFEASLLHICAEFNHVNCARLLLKSGADINVKAGFDEHGFGGQTPVFHTVNQHSNQYFDMVKLLIEWSADLTYTVKGIVWGKDYDWETFIPAVNPISYAIMGLLPQFQRDEKDIYHMVSSLINAAWGIHYFPPNLPNKYLRK